MRVIFNKCVVFDALAPKAASLKAVIRWCTTNLFPIMLLTHSKNCFSSASYATNYRHPCRRFCSVRARVLHYGVSHSDRGAETSILEPSRVPAVSESLGVSEIARQFRVWQVAWRRSESRVRSKRPHVRASMGHRDVSPLLVCRAFEKGASIRMKKHNKTDTGNGSYGICRVIETSRSPSPDPKR